MTDRTQTAPIGALLEGKFKILQEIGRGGMAVVYAAEHVDIGKRVAVKVLAAELASSKTVTERFMREARAAASLNSPYICEVYDVGTFQERPFIVMELLKGESLYDKLARERLLSVAEMLTITTQAGRGLKRAHENRIVHRDLKPENVFLSVNDEGLAQIKLVDFGLAKFYEPHLGASNARLTKDGALFGTPAYMSPEQARGKGNVDSRSDLWALACIVYEMLTGRTVWDIDQGVAMILAQIASSPPPTARRFRSDLPEAFDQWLAKALSREPNDRFQTTDEFLVGLELALQAVGAHAHLAPPTYVMPGSSSELDGGIPRVDSRPERTASPTPSSGGVLTRAGAPAFSAQPDAPALASSPSVVASDSRSRRRAIPLTIAGFVLAGLATLAVVRPAALLRFAQGLSTTLGASAFLGGSAPVETASWAPEIARAQALLNEQQGDAALEAFRAAFEAGQSKAARSFLAHVSVALESPQGTCKLSAIGHPRPFDAIGDSSKPTGIATRDGLMVAWADHGSGDEPIRTRLTFLNEPLHRIQAVSELTPETQIAREPELFKTNNGLGVLYWDFGGEHPGVYVRRLDEHGQIQGPPVSLSSHEASHPYYPAITPDGQGAFWVVWVEPSSPRVFDLFVRKLNSELSPISEPVAVTGYVSPRSGKTQVNRPAIAVRDNMLHISYSLRRGVAQQLLLLRVAADSAMRGPGVVAALNETSTNDEEGDRFLGTVQTLNATGNNDYPSIRCAKDACYVAWDEAKANGHIARLAPDGSVVWHRRLAADASRPSLATNAQGGETLLGWYENQRVQVASLSASGPSAATVVGRVSAALQQPPPGMFAGADAGDWFVAWRGYEAAVQEPFIARVTCQ